MTANHKKQNSLQRSDASISSGLLIATQNLIRAYLQEAYTAYNYGRSSFFESHNIDPSLIPQIQYLQPFEIDQFALNYARSVLSSPESDGLKVNINKAMNGILARCRENNLADRFLAAGASNAVMAEFFSMRSKECRLRRERLGVSIGRGRKPYPQGDDVLFDIFTRYDKALKKNQCPRQALLSVHEETGHFIDTIFRLLEKNKEYQLQE